MIKYFCFFTILIIGTIFTQTSFGYEYGAPRQQVNEGFEPVNVKCKEDLKLIFKPDKVIPACVKPQTFDKLIKRGWIENPIKVVFVTDKTEYKIGENITITMKNEGTITLITPSIPVGFKIVDSNSKTVASWIGIREAIGSFSPTQAITRIWDQKDIFTGAQVPLGNYTIVGDHFRINSNLIPTHHISIVS